MGSPSRLFLVKYCEAEAQPQHLELSKNMPKNSWHHLMGVTYQIYALSPKYALWQWPMEFRFVNVLGNIPNAKLKSSKANGHL